MLDHYLYFSGKIRKKIGGGGGGGGGLQLNINREFVSDIVCTL